MGLKFQFEDKEYRLVFKRATFFTPPIASTKELKGYKKDLRNLMREIIPSLKKEERDKVLEYEFNTENYKGDDSKLAKWVTTSAFVVNNDGIVGDVFTSVCDPFDRFEREDGRIRAIGMMKRNQGELGYAAAQCYGKR